MMLTRPKLVGLSQLPCPAHKSIKNLAEALVVAPAFPYTAHTTDQPAKFRLEITR